jgi:hypothetical protein
MRQKLKNKLRPPPVDLAISQPMHITSLHCAALENLIGSGICAAERRPSAFVKCMNSKIENLFPDGNGSPGNRAVN